MTDPGAEPPFEDRYPSLNSDPRSLRPPKANRRALAVVFVGLVLLVLLIAVLGG